MTDLISRADASGDLISRQWLLEVYGDYIGDNGEPKYHVPLEVVRQNIKDAPSADAEWIPCSERLPGKDGSYIVTSSFGKVYTSHYYAEHGQWQCNRRGMIEAWMPLPTPYKGGDE